jgi:hypothetical protein
LEEMEGEFPVCLVDISQCDLISLIKRLRQFIESMPDASWKAESKVDDLTIDPSEPR